MYILNIIILDICKKNKKFYNIIVKYILCYTFFFGIIEFQNKYELLAIYKLQYI